MWSGLGFGDGDGDGEHGDALTVRDGCMRMDGECGEFHRVGLWRDGQEVKSKEGFSPSEYGSGSHPPWPHVVPTHRTTSITDHEPALCTQLDNHA